MASSDGGVVLGILRLLVVVVTKQTRDKRNGIFVYVVESLLAALTFLRCCCVILADLVISALFLDEIKSLPSKRKGLRGFLVAERNIEFERNETKRMSSP